MEITKAARIPKNDNVVYLAEKSADFKKLGFSDKENEYIKKRLKDDKRQVIFDRLAYFEIVCEIVLEDKKGRKKKDFAIKESLRKAGDSLLSFIDDNNIKSLTVADLNGNQDYALAYCEGIALGGYRFIKYFSEDEQKQKKTTLGKISLYTKKTDSKKIDELNTLVDAVHKTRDLINEPVIYMNTERLTKELKKLSAESGFSLKTHNKKKIEEFGMGGLLAVNKGSLDDPAFSELTWKPRNAVNKKPVVIVGKGVMFDTGGLSIKPTPDSMDHMKADMSGAAAVAGTMYAIARSGLPVYVVGLIPATDNRPGGNAYAPGDIIKMHNGLHVEVLNTDAEGRMILADAISYASKFKPEVIMDIATLTGAAARAIGHYGLVVMGNVKDEYFKCLSESGDEVYERPVTFPFWDEYADLLKSDIADLKNIGGPEAGAITAGKFLEKFADFPFLHLDIAGPAFVKKKDSYRGTGGTGFGVRLLYTFLKNMFVK